MGRVHGVSFFDSTLSGAANAAVVESCDFPVDVEPPHAESRVKSHHRQNLRMSILNHLLKSCVTRFSHPFLQFSQYPQDGFMNSISNEQGSIVFFIEPMLNHPVKLRNSAVARRLFRTQEQWN
jgi:hypothetical protein